MAVWYEGENEINCTLQKVKDALDDQGLYYAGVVRLMPGMTSVELIEQGSDFVGIRTNEGLMKRSNISTKVEPDRVKAEFDEEYKAGRLVTVNSHVSDEFTESALGVSHRIAISDVKAPGLLGFFYRTFGKAKMGKALLEAHKSFLERQV